MIARLVATAFILGCCAIAWRALGGPIAYRTETSSAALQSAVGEMESGPQVQHALAVGLRLARPKEGLVWPFTYGAAFDGRGDVESAGDEAGLGCALVDGGSTSLADLGTSAATFFLEGVTGLAVTLLSVAVLLVVRGHRPARRGGGPGPP